MILEKGILNLCFDDSTYRIEGGVLNNTFEEFKKVRFNGDDVNRIIYDNINNAVGLILIQKYIHVLSDRDLDSMMMLGGDRLQNHPSVVDGFHERNEYRMNLKLKEESVGTKYTDLLLKTMVGDSCLLSDYVSKSEYTYLKFWASWCGPCIAEFPEAKGLCDKYTNNEFQLINISIDRDEKDWQLAIAEHEVPGINLLSDPMIAKDVYHVRLIPYGILLDKNGMILGVKMGADAIDRMLQK